MIRAIAALFALALSSCAGANAPKPVTPTPDPAALRSVSTGALAGYESNAAQVWRAIPFAAAPVGELRWRAPRPPVAWSGVRPAVSPAPWCPQILSALDGVEKSRIGQIVGQEDCLYLDVYAPKMSADAAAAAKLPVMMWIHGGSNTWGRAEQYDGAILAARHNVIVVIVQYRLGPLGWFAHESLRAEGAMPEDASPNFAMLDHIRALEWIRDEIKPFGGDTSRVTIFGESAGGHNVAALLASGRAKGLFHRAIVQSGSFKTVSLAEAEGLSGDRADSGRAVAAKLTGGAPVTGAALRAAPTEKVFAAYDTTRGNWDPPRVIADGIVLPADGMLSALRTPATFNAVPIISGANRDETKLFNALDPKLVKFHFGRFPKPRDPAVFEALSQYQSRMWRINAVDEPLDLMVAGGHGDVYAYRFDWDEQAKIAITDLSTLLGAAHGMEIPFVFGKFQLLGAFDKYAFTKDNAPGRLDLSDRIMSYWANFAATGAPGRGVDGKGAEWAAWSRTGDKLLLLDSAAGGGVRMTPHGDTRADVVRDLFSDASMKTISQKCQVFASTKRWNPELAGADGKNCPP